MSDSTFSVRDMVAAAMNNQPHNFEQAFNGVADAYRDAAVSALTDPIVDPEDDDYVADDDVDLEDLEDVDFDIDDIDLDDE